MIDFDFSDLTDSDLEATTVVEPGTYGATVVRAQEGEKALTVEFRIDDARNGAPENQIGLVHREHLPFSPKAQVRIAVLLLALGWSGDQVKSELSVDVADMIDRQCEIKIEPHTYTTNDGAEKTVSQVSFKGFRPFEPQKSADIYAEI